MVEILKYEFGKFWGGQDARVASLLVDYVIGYKPIEFKEGDYI